MKRSGFKPKVKPMAGILRTTNLPAPKKPGLAAKPKTRKCKICPTRFVSRGIGHIACSVECALEVVKRKREKDACLAAKLQRADLQRRKQDAKTIPELKKEVEQACHAWIRYRDRDKGCIDCGRFPKVTGKPGGDWDAGHYLSRGSADHLRFDERNIHRQMKGCNRPGGATRQAYREGLIKRIGLAEVEALESDQTFVKWTREMLIEKRDYFRAKLKEAKAQEKACHSDVPTQFAQPEPAKEAA